MIRNQYSGKPKRQITIDGNIARVPLSRGKVAIIDAADVHLVEGRNWCDDYGYAIANIRKPDGARTTMKMHRLIMSPPDDMQIDHINGDKFDNRRCNLRLATNAQNACNRAANATNVSGFKGVTWRKDISKWMARIKLDGKDHYLGCHDTAKSAHAAYCAVVARMHGEFANTGE